MCLFPPQSKLLVVGFTNGEFRLYEIEDFNLIQLLSMGQNAVNTVNINKTGEWLAFGSAKWDSCWFMNGNQSHIY